MIDTSGRRSVILCMEALHDGRRGSARWLTPESYVVVHVETPAAAARMARLHVFDAYLVQATHRPSDALRLCRLIRRRDPHAPLLVYAESVTAELRAHAARSGVTRVLDPGQWTPRDIVKAIARHIGEAELANLAAVSAEILATHEHVARLAGARPGGAHDRYAESAAMARFIGAGGTRAGYRRCWLAVAAASPIAAVYH